jgi:glutamate:Na+ symporter, ESS family
VEPQAVQQSDSPVLQKLRWVSLVGSFPLFIYTLFGGLIIAQLLASAGRARWLDGQASGRISSVAMDLLVVAAITTLNLEAVVALLLPVAILFVGGAVWAAVCLFALSPRILPRSHWFELGLINYGMSTGVTATGFVLLRLVDPQLRTDAAKHYALAAPLSAPFVGGGLITIALPLLVLQRVPIGLSAVVSVVVVALLIVLGIRLGRESAPSGPRTN